MASPLVWKVYVPSLGGRWEYFAATRYPKDAASVVANTVEGVVKVDGRIVWREGNEETTGSDSVDRAAQIMHQRRKANR